MSIKDEILVTVDLDKKHREILAPQLDDLLHKPTVLIVVEQGVANYYFLPLEDPITVNVVLVDLDLEASDTVLVSREE